MSDGMLAYDPDRLNTLARRCAEAIDYFNGITSDEPLAKPAIDTARRIAHKLSTVWLPMFARLGADTSMISWDSSGPAGGGGASTRPALVPMGGGEDDEEVRASFEADFDEELSGVELSIAVVQSLGGADAVAYWNTLTADERRELIDQRPDLAYKVLEGGGTLTDEELQLLDEANAFPELSEGFAVRFNVEVGRVVTINLSGGWSAVVRKMSDGTVQVAIVEDVHLGAGVQADSGDGDSASAGAGVFAKAHTVLVFPDEESAADVIEDVEDAINDVGWDDYARLGGQVVWFFLNPGGVPPPFLLEPDKLDEIVDELWDEYGAAQTQEGGFYGEVSTSVRSELAKAGLTARVRIAAYTTEATELADQPGRNGVIVSGTLGGHAESESSGGSASAEGSFTVNVYTENDGDEDGGELMTVTVQGSASTGAVAELVDHAGVDVDVQSEGGGQVTVTVTVPLNGATAETVTGVVTSLASGQVPTELGELYDAADVTVSVDATVETTLETNGDFVVAEGSEQRSETHTENIVTYHKFPEGEMYSQTELNERVDEERGLGDRPDVVVPVEVPHAPYDPDEVEILFDQNGEPVAAETPDGIVPLEDDANTDEQPDGAEDATAPTLLEQLGAEPDEPTADTGVPALDDDRARDLWGDDSDVIFDPDGEPVAVYTGSEHLPIGGTELLYDEDGEPVAVDTGDDVIRLDDPPDDPDTPDEDAA